MSRPTNPADNAVDNFEAFRRWYLEVAAEVRGSALPEWQRHLASHFIDGKANRRRAVLVSKRQPGKWADTVDFIAHALIFGVVCFAGNAPRHLRPDQPTLAVASPRHDTELLEDARNLAHSWVATAGPGNSARSLLVRGRHEA